MKTSTIDESGHFHLDTRNTPSLVQRDKIYLPHYFDPELRMTHKSPGN